MNNKNEYRIKETRRMSKISTTVNRERALRISANIAIFSDYDHRYTAENGFTERLDVIKRNEIRYNYFSGSAIGFKHKSGQLLTGRNPGKSDFDDRRIRK